MITEIIKNKKAANPELYSSMTAAEAQTSCAQLSASCGKEPKNNVGNNALAYAGARLM